jgi:hypothetical protein
MAQQWAWKYRPVSYRVQAHVPEAIYTALQDYASAHGLGESQAVRQLLADALHLVYVEARWERTDEYAAPTPPPPANGRGG